MTVIQIGRKALWTACTMVDLIRGANAPLSQMRFDTVLRWPTAAGALDASVFLVGTSGHVRGDADMIFYNQPNAQNQCIRLLDNSNGLARFSVSLPDIPDDVAKVIFCLTVDGPGRSMADFNGMELVAETSGSVMHQFRPSLGGADEVAMMVAELYRRDAGWKIRAVAQGFRGGLAALATSMGVDVESEDETASAANQTPPAPEAPRTMSNPAIPQAEPPWPPAGPEPSEPVPPKPQARTAGARLLLPADRVAIEAGSGRLTVGLDWRWRIGGDGRVRPIGLSLGAAYVGASGARGAVQIPDYRGQLDASPWLMVVPGSPRAPDSGQERLVINLDQRAAFEWIDIFVFISKGSSTWIGCEAWVNISGPLPQPLEYRIDSPGDGQAAIALLRLIDTPDGRTIQRLDQPGAHQAELDSKLNWGLDWRFPSVR